MSRLDEVREIDALDAYNRANQALTIGAIALVLIAVAGGVFGWLQYQQARTARQHQQQLTSQFQAAEQSLRGQLQTALLHEVQARDSLRLAQHQLEEQLNTTAVRTARNRETLAEVQTGLDALTAKQNTQAQDFSADLAAVKHDQVEPLALRVASLDSLTTNTAESVAQSTRDFNSRLAIVSDRHESGWLKVWRGLVTCGVVAGISTGIK